MARVTITKQLGAGMMMSEFIAKMAQEKMVEMVEKVVKEGTSKDWLPFNLKVYIQQNGSFDLLDNFAQLGLKVDAVYMGSSWGLLKMVARDLLSQKWERFKHDWHRFMVAIKIKKDEDWD